MRLVVDSRLLAAGTMVLALVGCGPASASRSPDLTPLAFDLVTQTGSFQEGQHALTAAEHRLTEDCMARKGLAYPVEIRPIDARTDEERLIGLESRRRNGYGLFDSWVKASSSDQVDQVIDFPSELDRYVARLPESEKDIYRQALFGDEGNYQAIQLPDGSSTSFPQKGCIAEARAALFGDVVSWARIAYVPQTFNNLVTKQVINDPGYTVMIGEWRKCMASRGYNFATPDAAVKEVSAGYSTSGSTPEMRTFEIAVAVADGECARGSHIPTRVLELKKRFLLTLSDNERLALNTLADLWCSAVERGAKST